MAKQRKKRNKRYQGSDAKVTAPLVTRVSAEERTRFKEWWLVYGQITRMVGIFVGGIAVLVLIVIGIIGLL